jgi:SAM-dependent methyltransferase
MSIEKKLYEIKGLPVLQNKMFSSVIDAVNCATGDMQLVQNLETGLIYNKDFRSELAVYDENYQNEQALSNSFQKHLDDVAALIMKNFGYINLIEVGCGKGYFLEQLQKLGFKITGLDPTYEGENKNIVKEFFTPKTGIKGDGIILRHVLEHVENPVDFLFDISESNGNQGKIYIEVPCFDWICSNRAWFDVFYEHVNYFRLSDFNRIFKKVYESGHVFGGQYIYVVADLESIRRPKYMNTEGIHFPNDFCSKIDFFKNLLQESPKTSVVWGGASKGVIFSLFMKRMGISIESIIDINPAKQGRYIACTGLKISPPEILKNAPSNTNVIIMNGNYASEIKELTKGQFNYYGVENERF